MNLEAYFEMLQKMEEKNKLRHAQHEHEHEDKDKDEDVIIVPSSNDMHWR